MIDECQCEGAKLIYKDLNPQMEEIQLSNLGMTPTKLEDALIET